MNIEETFLKHDSEFLKFDRVKNKRNRRSDIHAFLLLDEILWRLNSDDSDIVSAAEHNTIYLRGDVNELERVITESEIVELIRCGVMYESDTESLYMYV